MVSAFRFLDLIIWEVSGIFSLLCSPFKCFFDLPSSAQDILQWQRSWLLRQEWQNPWNLLLGTRSPSLSLQKNYHAPQGRSDSRSHNGEEGWSSIWWNWPLCWRHVITTPGRGAGYFFHNMKERRLVKKVLGGQLPCVCTERSWDGTHSPLI